MYVNIYSTDPSARPEFPLQLRLRQHRARDQADPGHRQRQDSRQPQLCHAGLAESRPHAGLQRVLRRRHEGLAEQSMIGSPGRLGQATGRTSQTVEYVLTWVGRYNKPEQYENIILKANPDGEILRLKDVAEVELGPSFYNIYSDIDGHPSAAIVLKQTPGSNAADVIEEVKEKLEEIKKESFPPGMDYEVSLRRFHLPGGLDREGAAHPVRGLHVGVAGGLHVPRGFAFHADPDPGGSGIADRDLLFPAVARSVDQPDHALRAGAGDRRRGGRRDRGGRSGACQDGTRSTSRPIGRPRR